MTSRKKTALQLASEGWLVVPMYDVCDDACSCHKGNACPSPAKHPLTPHGVKDASSDRVVVKKWWRENPSANIGIAMGPKSGLIALDVDPRNGGTTTLRAKEKQLGKLPETATTLTGGGGIHLIFKHPPFFVQKDTSGKTLGPGVDILAAGSIMIVPPSRHVSGKRYRWDGDKSLLKMDPTDLPANWVAALRGRDDAEQSCKPVGEKVSEGLRNSHLTSLAGRLRNTGVSPDTLLAALKAENDKTWRPAP